ESKDMTIINEHDDFKIKSIENEIIQSVNEYMRYNEIEFLKELSKDKPKFTKECIDNMIYILENSTLTYSLNFFKKVPLYFDNHLIKYFLIKEDIEYEEVRYSNILASLMLLLYKVNPIEISSVTTIVNKEVKNVTDSYIQTAPNIYLDQIVRLFYKNFIPLSKKLNKDLKYLKCNCENFVLENDSYKDLSMNIIEEIIQFLKKSPLNFYCKSEVDFLNNEINGFTNHDLNFLAAKLVFLYLYATKIILKNKLLNETISYKNQFHELLKNREFLADLIYFKFLFLKILRKNYKNKCNLYSYHKVTIFLLFARLCFEDSIDLLKDMDIWWLEEIINDDKIRDFEYQKLNFIVEGNFLDNTTRQKRIFIAIYIEANLSKKNLDKYSKLIDILNE
ncbi:hypothetical protein H311_03485, partial [Anncaliia algerae PRA109]